MIRVSDLTFLYSGNKILNSISFFLEKNAVLSILGKNGAGKTTLLKCINRLLTPKSGKIEIDGADISRLSLTELSRIIGYVPQITHEEPMTIFDSVLLGRKPYLGFKSTKEDLYMVEEMLDYLGLADHAFKFTTELSGGEYQKVVIARLLVKQPKVLLLDEPINNLDLKNQFQIMGLIKHVAKKHGVTVVLSIHDINMAHRYSDYLLLMKDSSVFYYGVPNSVNVEKLSSIYNVHLERGEIKNSVFFFPVVKEE